MINGENNTLSIKPSSDGISNVRKNEKRGPRASRGSITAKISNNAVFDSSTQRNIDDD